MDSVNDLRDHPDALAGADSPRIEQLLVAGTRLHVEIRGIGPPILLIPGGAEDAEGWRPVAERLAGHTVITYDRRGTLRSGREEWPGGGSAQHADDAAALIGALGLDGVVAFGGSSGGVIALRLAQRHPDLVRRALIYEPGFLCAVPAGRDRHAAVVASIAGHLAQHPDDWVGAYDEFLRSNGLYAPPKTSDWYAGRERLNAEPFICDDVPIISAEAVGQSVAEDRVDVRLAHGSDSASLFHEVTAWVAAQQGVMADLIHGTGHALYLRPDAAALWIVQSLGIAR